MTKVDSPALEPLPSAFFQRHAEIVARELLGHHLVRRVGSRALVLRIVESEAYLGAGDRASHAWRGIRTGRAVSLFRSGGAAYVYLVYGIHFLFNVVTGGAEDGSAVLVRAGEPVSGLRTMMRNRGITGSVQPGEVAGGPGKLCQALAIVGSLNGVPLDRGELTLCRGESLEPEAIVCGPRIGVDYAGDAADWLLRFAEQGNRHVSRPHPW